MQFVKTILTHRQAASPHTSVHDSANECASHNSFWMLRNKCPSPNNTTEKTRSNRRRAKRKQRKCFLSFLPLSAHAPRRTGHSECNLHFFPVTITHSVWISFSQTRLKQSTKVRPCSDVFELSVQIINSFIHSERIWMSCDQFTAGSRRGEKFTRFCNSSLTMNTWDSFRWRQNGYHIIFFLFRRFYTSWFIFWFRLETTSHLFMPIFVLFYFQVKVKFSVDSIWLFMRFIY